MQVVDEIGGDDPAQGPFGRFLPPLWMRPGLVLARRVGEHSVAARVVLKPLRVLLRRYRVPVDTTCIGLRMRLHHYESLHQAWLLFYPRRVDPRAVAFLRAALRPGGTFLDAGAHVGFYALAAAQRVGARGKVLAVEADPRNFSHLVTNITLNQASQIVAVNAALSDSFDELALTRNDANRGSITTSATSPEAVRVPGTPLWDLLKRHELVELDAAKFDIEGFEHRVLSRFFHEAPRRAFPRRLVIEVGEQFGPTTPLLELLSRVGYQTRFVEFQNHALELR